MVLKRMPPNAQTQHLTISPPFSCTLLSPASTFTKIKNCLSSILHMNILWQSSLLFNQPIPEARSNYDSTSAIELWLSVPRLLGVWLCRLDSNLSYKNYNITYSCKVNRQHPCTSKFPRWRTNILDRGVREKCEKV